MTPARTEVGIAEWSRRARGACATELRLADALGALLARTDGASAKIAVSREARRHGWYAQLWAHVVPVLHDHDRELERVDRVDGVPLIRAHDVTRSDDPQVVVAGAADALAAQYRAWLSETTPIADAPIAAVLRLVLGAEPGSRS